ncbi:MAG: hypothetical protein F6K40_21555 [Okeania sp. SIO3I5]|uniref:hypothetical protein n=1 Tax=Okeania sp. SIO3I5 TaxID=2607805 RepID=UPI0013BBDEDC|nr:hypothetical protein [Okeania sp. SIO3I5]NEQ38714.1 hypothetical protein [Okeania sp. SIO3I5]
MSLQTKLDPGEAEAIVLVLELKADLLDLSLNRGKKSLKIRQSNNSRHLRFLIAIIVKYQGF